MKNETNKTNEGKTMETETCIYYPNYPETCIYYPNYPETCNDLPPAPVELPPII